MRGERTYRAHITIFRHSHCPAGQRLEVVPEMSRIYQPQTALSEVCEIVWSRNVRRPDGNVTKSVPKEVIMYVYKLKAIVIMNRILEECRCFTVV